MKKLKTYQTAKVDWVFWISLSFRNWYKLFWTTRGANFRDIQIGFIRVSIGLPWLNSSMTYQDYLDEHTYKTNSENLNAPLSILIKRNP